VPSDIRAEEIATLRARGLKLHEIAEHFGISGARVGQILLAHGGPDTSQAEAARRLRAEQAATARIGELLAIWRSGAHLVVAAKELGLEPTGCAAAIANFATDADRAARRANIAGPRVATRTYSDDDIYDALIYVAVRVGRTPTVSDYAVVARERGFPSPPTIRHRMGSWSNAITGAGLAPRASTRSSTRRWTEEACWEAVRAVVEEVGEIPSLRAYERIASGRADLPSAATVRHRLGRWGAVISRLALDSAAPAESMPQGHRPS
jgi:HNH endonuclease